MQGIVVKGTSFESTCKTRIKGRSGATGEDNKRANVCGSRGDGDGDGKRVLLANVGPREERRRHSAASEGTFRGLGPSATGGSIVA